MHTRSSSSSRLVLALALTLVATTASAKTIYVAGTGDDKNDGSTPQRALRTIRLAATKTAAGDVVEVDDGVYDAFTIAISGTEAAWIRYVAKSGAKPKIQFTGWNGIYLETAHHIEIRGFEVAGPMASRTLAQCTADADAATPDPLCNANGISIDTRKVTAKSHHVLIAENDVHDCPGGGISAIQSDYVTVEKNFVHGNAWHTRYGASGISFLTPWSSDTATGVKMIVRQNRVFDNKTLVKWVQIQKLSDGNGIIIDTSRNVGATPPLAPYNGRFLVENNLSVGNGGSGIHAFQSDHVDIVHNTTFENGQVVGYAEIFANDSNDVRIVNNVMIGRADGGVNTNDPKSDAHYDFNVYFGGAVKTKGSSDIEGDPRVVKASHDPAVADFRLGDGSPAIDTATPTVTSAVDLAGAPRPSGVAPDRGAYERVVGGDAGPLADAATGTPGDDAGTSFGDAGGVGSTNDGGSAGGASENGSGCSCRAAGGGGDGPLAFSMALFATGAVALIRTRASSRGRRRPR